MVQPLSNVQMEILQAFRFEMDDDQLRDFRQHLVDYFANRVDEDIDRLFEEKGWSVKDKVDEWGATHMRTAYKPER